MCEQPTRKAVLYSMNSNGTELKQVVHTHRTWCRSAWPRFNYRELKHQTLLIHKRHGWQRRTGWGTQFMCQMQIIKQNNVKPSRTPTEWFRWKFLSKICITFCFFLTKKTWFQTKNFYFCMTNTLRRTQNLNLWFQPENSRFEVRDRSSRTSWHAQWLSCCKNTSGWRRGSKNVWCLSSLTRTNQHSVAEIIMMQTFYQQRLTSIDCGFTLQGMSGRLDKGGHEAKFDTMLL